MVSLALDAVASGGNVYRDSGAAQVRLRPGEVHVWRVLPTEIDVGRFDLSGVLSADELAMADRRCTNRERLDYLVAHLALRDILGQYLELSPERLRFRAGRHGKPELDGAPLHFSLSHTDSCVVIAVAVDRPVGVDVECLEPVRDWLPMASRFFAPSETAVIRSADLTRRNELFLRYWTCKESYLKAVGCGLDKPLDSVRVRLSLFSPGEGPSAPHWFLGELTPTLRHVGALCTPGSVPEMCHWCWLGDSTPISAMSPPGMVSDAGVPRHSF